MTRASATDAAHALIGQTFQAGGLAAGGQGCLADSVLWPSLTDVVGAAAGAGCSAGEAGGAGSVDRNCACAWPESALLALLGSAAAGQSSPAISSGSRTAPSPRAHRRYLGAGMGVGVGGAGVRAATDSGAMPPMGEWAAGSGEAAGASAGECGLGALISQQLSSLAADDGAELYSLVDEADLRLLLPEHFGGSVGGCEPVHAFGAWRSAEQLAAAPRPSLATSVDGAHAPAAHAVGGAGAGTDGSD